MTTLAITDLPLEHALERAAMSNVRGGDGAGWVYGWIQPFIPRSAAVPDAGMVLNFFQTNNFFLADQMNNQFQTIDINNTAANARINVSPELLAVNQRH
jgi:hypothetical protein